MRATEMSVLTMAPLVMAGVAIVAIVAVLCGGVLVMAPCLLIYGLTVRLIQMVRWARRGRGGRADPVWQLADDSALTKKGSEMQIEMQMFDGARLAREESPTWLAGFDDLYWPVCDAGQLDEMEQLSRDARGAYGRQLIEQIKAHVCEQEAAA